jgi:hypothetical protein
VRFVENEPPECRQDASARRKGLCKNERMVYNDKVRFCGFLPRFVYEAFVVVGAASS